MAVNLNVHPTAIGNVQTAVAVKVAQLSKQQMQAEGNIALQLINATTPADQADAPATAGNLGTIINTTA
ncbi:cytoplasmic protein [Shewanella sp. A32]|uniref:cytoplasmic protein n=1 Tax=Shewanella sp. A32 TaxID=3031327 RepID=UPI0023B90A3D|nr:cytoplasmic protein [Shewanella sp. A32]MDF0533930.1 cytoplasmic protein [Shewanella sp. A32]